MRVLDACRACKYELVESKKSLNLDPDNVYVQIDNICSEWVEFDATIRMNRSTQYLKIKYDYHTIEGLIRKWKLKGVFK